MTSESIKSINQSRKNILVIGTVTGPKMRGVGQYVLSLVKYLSIQKDFNITVVTHPETKSIFNQIDGISIVSVSIPYKWAIFTRPWLYAYFFMRIGRLINRLQIDIVHLPNVLFFPKIRNAKLITTIHDVAEYRIKKYSFLRTFWRKMMVKRLALISNVVITVSKTSGAAIKNELGIKAITVYPYWMLNQQKQTRVRQTSMGDSFPSNQPFILYAGSDLPHKNLPFLLDVWRKNPDLPQLVLIGEFGKQITRVASDIKNVHVIGYVDEHTKEKLMSKMSALVFASSYEGFGLPIIEAISFNKPIVCTHISVFKETLNTQAYYFEINDEDSFKKSLKSAITREKVEYSTDHLYQNKIETVYDSGF